MRAVLLGPSAPGPGGHGGFQSGLIPGPLLEMPRASSATNWNVLKESFKQKPKYVMSPIPPTAKKTTPNALTNKFIYLPFL